jgi:hypothetical protein
MVYSLEIVPDMDPINPRKDRDFSTIYYSSSRYNLGDNCVSKDEIESIIEDKEMVYLPVYAYIHSGVMLNTGGFSCPWDSGMSGVIAVSKDKIRQEYNTKRITQKILEQVTSRLKAEVEEFSKYLNGEVYGFQVKDESGDIVESCYGFYSEEDAEAEGKAALDYFNKKAA